MRTLIKPLLPILIITLLSGCAGNPLLWGYDPNGAQKFIQSHTPQYYIRDSKIYPR